MGLFGVGLGTGGGQKGPLPKICHTYLTTMMKLGTVIPYLKNIQKTYKSYDVPLQVCGHQHFFIGNQQVFVISRNADIDYVLIYNF